MTDLKDRFKLYRYRQSYTYADLKQNGGIALGCV